MDPNSNINYSKKTPPYFAHLSQFIAQISKMQLKNPQCFLRFPRPLSRHSTVKNAKLKANVCLGLRGKNSIETTKSGVML